jgi:hypothetical protein
MSTVSVDMPRTINRFADAQALAAADMLAVDSLIRTRLASDVVLINQIAEHIIGGGGTGRWLSRRRTLRVSPHHARGRGRIHPHRHLVA